MNVEKPPAKLSALSRTQRDNILDEVRKRSELGIAWEEKLRTFTSLYGRNLRKEAKKRFGSKCIQHLNWFADVLSVKTENSSNISAAKLNGLLYVADAITSRTLNTYVMNKLTELEKFLVATASVPIENAHIGHAMVPDTEVWKKEVSNLNPVVIICPMKKSLYTLLVLQLCVSLNLPVEAIIIRKLSFARLRHEFKRDGTRLIKKVWRKLILKGDENSVQTDISMSILCKMLQLNYSDVEKFAQSANIPIIPVTDLDTPNSKIRNLRARYAFFTGGGLVGKNVLEIFNGGVINVHMGSLPQYKGMDVIEAPILDGCFDDVAMTAHFMESRLDAGPVISVFKTNSEFYASLGELRNTISAIAPIMMVDAYLGVMSGRYQVKMQPNTGKQYFIIHKRLKKLIEIVLKERHVTQEKPNNVKLLIDSLQLGRL